PGVAVRGGLHGDLIEHPTGADLDHGGRVGVHVGVDADDDVDDLAQIGQTGHCVLLLAGTGTWFRSGAETRQDCDETRPGAVNARTVKLLIRPAAPTGPVPATTSGQVTPKARSQSGQGSRSQSPTTAHHHQAAKGILTVRPETPFGRQSLLKGYS